MKRSTFWYQVVTEVHITKAEVDQLIEAARTHYDMKCRHAAIRGGFLYGIQNEVGDAESAKVQLDIRQLDTLCKITEMIPPVESSPTHWEIKKLLVDASEEYRRVNAHWIDD